jgi:hypothetical protein
VGRIAIVAVALALWCASASAATGPRFVARGDGVVRDARTKLEWTRDDGRRLAWHDADAYCRTLPLAGGRWRLPVVDELHALYDPPPRSPCGETTCGIDPLFGLGSPYVWTATGEDDSVRTYLDFSSGSRFMPSITPKLVRHVLCVRAPVPAPARPGTLRRRDRRQPQ